MVEVSEYSPVESFYRAYGRWWLIAVLMLVGGLAGWLFHQLRPPVYEARAVMVVNVNFGQSGPLTEFEQDNTIWAAQAMLRSPAVLDQVAAAGQDLGLPQDSLVYGKNLFLERRQGLLELIARQRNPEAAAAMANLWADKGYAALTEAHTHAMKAHTLRAYLRGLEQCGSPETAGVPLCAGPEQVRSEIETVLQEIENEMAASRGILPALSFGMAEPAAVPDKPAAFGLNWLVMAGALVGMIVGAAASAAGSKR